MTPTTADPERTRARTTPAIAVASVLALGALGCAGVAHAKVTVEPTVEVGTTYVDNGGLTEDGTTAQNEWLIDLRPSLHVEVEAPRLDALLDYTFRRIEFMSNGSSSQSYHTLESGAEYELIDKLLTLHADASYTQTLQDPTRLLNFQQIFDVGNVVDQVVYGGGPRLHKAFTSTFVDATYDVRKVDYKGLSTSTTAITEDSTNHYGTFKFGSDPERRGVLAWTFDAETHLVDYQFTPSYRYDSAIVDLGFELMPGFFLVGDGGLESDIAADPGKGGFDSTRWTGGIRWVPNRNDRVELRMGHRFGGTSYQGSIVHVARALTVRASYLEAPTTQYEAAGRSATITPGTPTGAPPITPTDPLTGLTRPTTEVFLNKDLRAEASITGARTTITLTGYRQIREYFSLGASDRALGTGLEVVRRLGPRTDLSLRANREDLQGRGGVDFRYWTAAFTVTRRISTKSSVQAEILHVDQDQGAVRRSKANAASLRFTIGF